MSVLSNLAMMTKNRLPGQLVIQMTDRCNATCPQCGMRVTEKFQRTSLDTSQIKKVIAAAAEKGFQAISFTGGEPLLHLNRLIELIHYAGDQGIPFIRTGTNGFIFQGSQKPGYRGRIERLASRLAKTPLRNFWISIDSADPTTHEDMRGFPGIIRGIEKSLPIFHRHGIYPSANLGINRNMGGRYTRDLVPQNFSDWKSFDAAFYATYRLAFTRFYEKIIRMGFTIVNTCYPMSIGKEEIDQGLEPVYAATSLGDIVSFRRREKALLFKALLDVIPSFRSKIRIFTPLCALRTLSSAYRNGGPSNRSYNCRGGIDFFFVDARLGHIYPCGYRGAQDLGELQALDISKRSPDKSSPCRQCDWECFRDPSELLGPFLEGFSNPLGLAKRIGKEPSFFNQWRRDLQYYWACDLFDGRRAPLYHRMRNVA